MALGVQPLLQPLSGRVRPFFSVFSFGGCIRGPITRLGYRAVQCTMYDVQSRRLLFQSQTILCSKKWRRIADRSPPFLGLQITVKSDQSSPTFVLYYVHSSGLLTTFEASNFFYFYWMRGKVYSFLRSQGGGMYARMPQAMNPSIVLKETD